MQTIVPFLWFADEARSAVEFYVSAFRNARITATMRFDNVPGPPEKVTSLTFELEGQEFMALNGGPGVFSFSPAVSLFVSCGTADETERLWRAFADGATVLMPLDRYPFSERFGWLQDRFGVSWQFDTAARPQKIAPCLLFVGDRVGKVEDAMRFYTSLFPDSAIDSIARYEKDDVDREGLIKHAEFRLAGQLFMAMESSLGHAFGFTGAISFFVKCRTQQEVDRFWSALTAGGDPRTQQCGWLADRYGVYWQIIPTALTEMLADPDREKARRVTRAMLGMKKLDIAGLEAARG